jgi:hypothetical protein
MISNKTKITYNIVLKKLTDNKINIDNPLIKDFDDFCKEEKLGYSAINVYNSALLYNFREKNINYEYFDVIKEKMQEIRTKINKEKLIKNGKLNDKEKDKITTWNNIIEMHNKLKELVKTNDKFKKFYMDWVIISIYVFIQRRTTDISNLYLNDDYELPKDNNTILWYMSTNIEKYGSFESYYQQKVFNNKNIDTKNYYVRNKRGIFLVFNDYKTYKIYGIQIFEISDDLANIINKYIVDKNINNNCSLFCLTESNLIKRMNNIFKIMLNKSISSAAIKHSYIQHFLKTNKTYYEKEKLARYMAHSIGMQLEYNFEFDGVEIIDIDKNINEYITNKNTYNETEKKKQKK